MPERSSKPASPFFLATRDANLIISSTCKVFPSTTQTRPWAGRPWWGAGAGVFSFT